MFAFLRVLWYNSDMKSETEVQLALMKAFMIRRKRYQAMIPNFYGAFGWESDLLGITRYGYLHEFEIKHSVSDLEREFSTKATKHANLKDALGADDIDRRHVVPKRFYFVISGFWYSPKNLPDYVGLIRVDGSRVKTMRQAPDLAAEKITSYQMTKIIVSMSYRWMNTVKRED